MASNIPFYNSTTSTRSPSDLYTSLANPSYVKVLNQAGPILTEDYLNSVLGEMIEEYDSDKNEKKNMTKKEETLLKKEPEPTVPNTLIIGSDELKSERMEIRPVGISRILASSYRDVADIIFNTFRGPPFNVSSGHIRIVNPNVTHGAGSIQRRHYVYQVHIVMYYGNRYGSIDEMIESFKKDVSRSFGKTEFTVIIGEDGIPHVYFVYVDKLYRIDLLTFPNVNTYAQYIIGKERFEAINTSIDTYNIKYTSRGLYYTTPGNKKVLITKEQQNALNFLSLPYNGYSGDVLLESISDSDFARYLIRNPLFNLQKFIEKHPLSESSTKFEKLIHGHLAKDSTLATYNQNLTPASISDIFKINFPTVYNDLLEILNREESDKAFFDRVKSVVDNLGLPETTTSGYLDYVSKQDKLQDVVGSYSLDRLTKSIQGYYSMTQPKAA